MYTLGPEEKVSVVMVYTQTGLIRGEVVTRDTVRINTWLRTDSAPEYIHMYKSQWIQSTGGQVRSLAYAELLLPITPVIGFHLAPPSTEPLDYNEREDNRVNKPIMLLMGLFTVKGRLRVSSQTDISTSLQISHSQWMSVYDAEIGSPQIPQMPPFTVPMMLVRAPQAFFILQE
jgi:hypothetical protein